MIIEVTGSPCSGKSYNLKRFSVMYDCIILDNIFLNKFLKIHYLPNPVCSLLRESFQLYTGLSSINPRLFILILKYILCSRWSFFRMINAFRNVIKKYSLHYVAHQNKELNFIIDEGVYHIPYIFSTSHINYTPELLVNIYNLDVLVLCINTDLEVLHDRIMQRGHPSLDILKTDQPLVFLLKNQHSLILQIYFLTITNTKFKFISLDEY